VFTVTSNSVFMVGGRRDTVATKDIWRFDLDSGSWTFEPFGPPLIGDVRALGFDAQTNRMVVVDIANPDLRHPTASKSRIVLFDLATHTARVLATRPSLANADHVTVTSRQDGSYILLSSTSGETRERGGLSSPPMVSSSGTEAQPSRATFSTSP